MNNHQNSFHFIDSIVVTEKSSLLNDKFGKLVFFVPISMTKDQIRSMIRARFENKIKIKKIATLITHGKNRRFRGVAGKLGDRKKVILTTEGEKISSFEGL